jgi:F-type H+-transporting ATPase subunit gamma
MPTAREIKRRIGSIRNTQKITKAMEMVASVKLRKARAQILNARPYAEKLAGIAHHLRNSSAGGASPLLKARPVKKLSIVVVSSDKGLCGGFNANVVKKTLETIKANADKEVALTFVGKRAAEVFKRWKYTVLDKYPDVFHRPDYTDALTIGDKILADFLAGAVDEVVLVYNAFKSTVAYSTRVETILPVKPLEGEAATAARIDYIVEPEGAACLDVVLSKYAVFQVWRGMLESFASEQGARMAAMSGATKNAKELIAKFTLFYNKARQSAITKELIEVVSGAETLR